MLNLYQNLNKITLIWDMPSCLPLKGLYMSILCIMMMLPIPIFQYSSISVFQYDDIIDAPYSSAISPLRMLAVKKQKPEVQQ